MIRISTESGLRHSIEIGPHLLHTDVPKSLGGGASLSTRTIASGWRLWVIPSARVGRWRPIRPWPAASA